MHCDEKINLNNYSQLQITAYDLSPVGLEYCIWYLKESINKKVISKEDLINMIDSF